MGENDIYIKIYVNTIKSAFMLNVMNITLIKYLKIKHVTIPCDFQVNNNINIQVNRSGIATKDLGENT